MDINQFLVYLMGGGAVIAFSWIAEQVKSFQSLESGTKRLIQFGGSTVIGLGAWAVATYVPPEVLAALATPFKIVASIFVLVFLNQVSHVLDPNRQ